MAGSERVKQAIAVIGMLAAMLWSCTTVTAEQTEGQIAPLLPFTLQVQDFSGGRYMVRLAIPPYYTYVTNATAEVEALVKADQLTVVQSHASYLKPFYVVSEHIVSAGQCSRWKRVEVSVRTWGPVLSSMLCGSDPTVGDKAFATVQTGSGPQRLRVAAVANVEPLPAWGGHGNCRVTWQTGASMTFHCSAEEMIEALQKARAKPQARLPLRRSGPLRKAA